MDNKEILSGEVEFLPLLKDVPGQMLSRRMLAQYGVEDWMIEAHKKRGEVIVSGDGPLASIILIDVGAAAII